MSVVYDGSHSVLIKIGNATYNTWTDWHLIPASPPVVSPPNANISMIAIPGTSKIIDTTTLLSGSVTYGLQQGTWEFIINHEQWESSEACFQYLLNLLHGRYVTATLTDYPNKTYTGRMSIADRKPDANWSTITFNYYFPFDSSNTPDPSPTPSGGPDTIDLGSYTELAISSNSMSTYTKIVEYSTSYDISSYTLRIVVTSVIDLSNNDVTDGVAIPKWNNDSASDSVNNRFLNSNRQYNISNAFFSIEDEPYGDPPAYAIKWKLKNITSNDAWITYSLQLIKPS